MKNNYDQVERISKQGYDLEFGTILEKAFDNYKKIAGIGGIATLLIGLVIGVFIIALIGVAYGFSDMTHTLTGLSPESMSGSGLLVMLIISTVFAAIISPVNAGFIKMAALAENGSDFGISTIFDYYKGNHFRELFIATAIITFVSTGINYLITYFGILFWGSLAGYVIGFFTFLTIPLIIFSNLTATQAINMSAKLVLRQPLLLLGLLIIAIIFACLGIIGFCIGIFFTIPFLYSMYFTIYAAIIPSEANLLDEIGRTEE